MYLQKEKKNGRDKKILQPSHPFSLTYSLSQPHQKTVQLKPLTNHIIGSLVTHGGTRGNRRVLFTFLLRVGQPIQDFNQSPTRDSGVTKNSGLS
jgi:hypothetical protein